MLQEISSAIVNDLFGGNLIPKSNRSLISLEQIDDEVIAERELILREWWAKGAFTTGDYSYTIHCVSIDCDDMNKCPCKGIPGKITQHFEIPPVLNGVGTDNILFVGSTDGYTSFKIYYNISAIKFNKYRRNQNKPYVYIDKTPNENGMYDGWLFNAPMVKYIAVTAIFRDPRQLERYNCCESNAYLEMGGISSEIIRRLLVKKTNLYRTLPPPTSQIAD